MSNSLTVIIPTRERADTLFHTLRTCVTQDYNELRIIVSDNQSSDNTREVVDSFNDSRIRYINPGKRLSMSAHWEFALSHATDGFVTILGDDDGLLPNSLQAVDAILTETGVEAINMNPDPDSYFWPSYINPTHANLLKVSFQKGYEIREGKEELRRVMNCEAEYYTLPFIYNSFISVKAINATKRQTTDFFLSLNPDVYLGVAVANTAGRFVHARKRLCITGASSHSTGVLISAKTKRNRLPPSF